MPLAVGRRLASCDIYGRPLGAGVLLATLAADVNHAVLTLLPAVPRFLAAPGI